MERITDLVHEKDREVMEGRGGREWEDDKGKSS